AAKDMNSIPALEDFLVRYKDTYFAFLAQLRVEELKKQQLASAVPPKALEPTPQAKPAMTAPPGRAPAWCDGSVAQVGREKGCLKPKDSCKDCDTCPEMVVVPAGEFMMGSEEYNNEKPVHKVTIAKPFAVGKFEVTFAEWDACVSASGCKHKPDDRSWGRSSRPVMNASWDDITND